MKTINRLINFSLSPFFIAAAVFLYLQLQVYNLALLFRDEGYLVFSAQRILTGEIPYRDLFMTTTPGSFYMQALAMKFSSDFLLMDRILYILFILITLFTLNLVYRSKIINKYIVLIANAILLSGPAAIGYYNTEGFAIALVSFFLLCRGLDAKIGGKFIISAGLLMGIVFIFKQSYGFWIGVSFILILLFEKSTFKIKKERLIMFVAGSILFPFLYVLYLFVNNALSQFIYFTFSFAKIVKSHREAFVSKLIIGIPILFIFFKLLPSRISDKVVVLAVLVLTLVAFIIDYVFQIHYFEPSRIYYLIFIIFPIWIIARFPDSLPSNKLTKRIAIFFLFYFLANASSGRSIGIANISSVLFIPLVIDATLYINSKRRLFSNKIVYAALFVLVALHVCYLSWDGLNPNGKVAGVFKKDLTHKLNIPHAKHIKVTMQQKDDLEKIVNKINDYPADLKLLCFPYCPLLNVMVDRQSPSFFNLFYHETFLPQNQEQVIEELKSNNSIIVIQKVGSIEPEADFEDQRLTVLKKYLTQNYKKDFETENFVIYK